MSETLALSLPYVGDNLKLLPWVAWGARHVGDLPEVIAAAKEFAVIPIIPLRSKWEGFKLCGDTVVAVLEDAPPFVAALTVAPTAEALVAEELKFGDGTLLRLLLENLPLILSLIRGMTGAQALTDENIIEARFVG